MLTVEKLKLFKQCPLAYKKKYIDKMETPPVDTEFQRNIKALDTKDEKIEEMTNALYANDEFYQNIYPNIKKWRAKKKFQVLERDFVGTFDALGEDIIVKFVSSKSVWKDEDFKNDIEPILSMIAEFKRVEKWKSFYYVIVTTQATPRVQIKLVCFDEEPKKQVVEDINKIAEQIEKAEDYPANKESCKACPFKKKCK